MKVPMLMKVVPLGLVLAACTRESPAPSDDALSRDLALAAQASPYGPAPYASPQELGYGQQPYAPQYGQYGAYPQPYQPQPYYPQAQPVQTVYRAPAPAPRVVYRDRAPAPAPAQAEPVRHTKRDAMIGAATGAIAGAAIGRDVKGAVIGAAAGAVLGGIVGHTIDVEKP